MRGCFNQFLICFVMARRAFIIRGIFTTATHPFSPVSSRSVSVLVPNNIQTVNRWWIPGSQGTSTSLETFHQRRDSLLTRQNQFTVKKKKKECILIRLHCHHFSSLRPFISCSRKKEKKKKRKKFDQMVVSRMGQNYRDSCGLLVYLQLFKFVIRNFNMERL